MPEHDLKMQSQHLEFVKFQDEVTKLAYDKEKTIRATEFELLGINVIASTNPIITNLSKILVDRLKEMPFNYKDLYTKSEVLSLVHNIGAIRTQGRNKLKQIQFKVIITDPPETQTIDLIPSFIMKEHFKIGSETSLFLNSNGTVSTKIPEGATSLLSEELLNIHGDISLQLSNNTSFFGRINYSLKSPILQTMGKTTNSATWVLHPSGTTNRLLGDNLLIQIISIPKKTTHLTLRISGSVKVTDGIWDSEEKEYIDFSRKIIL